MRRKIHINHHHIRHNKKVGFNEKPVVTVKSYKENIKCDGVEIDGPSKVVYSPDKPLPCGAKVWIETDSPVTPLFGE